jgi:TRAP-type C4-dicarboxylate transport system substrate-binding protein
MTIFERDLNMLTIKRVFLVTAFVLACAAMPASAQTLKIATIAPEGSSWMTDMRAGAKAIEEHTDGRVKFKFYGGGVQGNDKQVQRKMRTGQLHGGAFTSGGLNMFQQDADLFSLPLAFNTVEEARHVREHLEAELRQRLEDAGYVNFGFAAAGFAYMMSNKPLATLADLEGQKIWTPEGDPVSFAALRALGVAPVVMPVTDVMTGLQTDLLDSVTVPPVGAVVLQWHTRLKYITNVPVAYVYAALLVDRKAFDRIAPKDQEVVREVMEGIYRKFDRNGVIDNDAALQALLESGLQMVEPNAAEVSQWREIVNRSHRELAREGVFDAALLDRMQTLLDDYRKGRGAMQP